MNIAAPVKPDLTVLSPAQQQAINHACGRIAPTWPLDQLIAVNPWWEMRDQPMSKVAARLEALSGACCLTPRHHFSKFWQRHIGDHHLKAAAKELGEAADVDQLVEHLREAHELPHWHNISDCLDSTGERQHKMAWRDEITQQISQFCAAFFQRGNPLNPSGWATSGLYRSWLDITRQDRGIPIIMGEKGLLARFEELPDSPEELLAEGFTELLDDHDLVGDYSHALLLDINGWASWAAYLNWQVRLRGRDSELLQELLAVRLAWELVLWRETSATETPEFRHLGRVWQQQQVQVSRLIEDHGDAHRLTWVWQRAAELAYQESLHRKLRQPVPEPRTKQPVLQAAFCIDVRSEVIRRALETQHSGIQTLGFAGFFGLPLEYQPVGTDLGRPQLPGLLKPAISVSENVDDNQSVAARRRTLLNRKARWQQLGEAAPATFSLVESTGLMYAFKLLRNTLFPHDHSHPVNNLEAGRTWDLSQSGKSLSLEEKTELAAGILRAMGLTGNFAATVLLVGHGSTTRNNPHAAGLDCGACGGQTGEINVRVLAQLLNDSDLREGLHSAGISIPGETRFIPALHNTTTDSVDCLGDIAPDERLNEWLQSAGRLARRERAAHLGLNQERSDGQLLKDFQSRARDWSQVRAEWGLANNASFIVAPRHRTRHLNLEGRSFLHDYTWQNDEGFVILELIMTAPMVVTNWINMQYNASVTDNLKYGSGNKVLHNVVGGNIGVFEGNGGDLRIGLPLQSLHDGERWAHQPLRLSVYLAAPRKAIADIAGKHAVVRQLIDNDWLYLFRLDDDGQGIERFYQGEWQTSG
jgi:uncharacterized protein YbcC (UPF0753/DUF2309 family)